MEVATRNTEYGRSYGRPLSTCVKVASARRKGAEEHLGPQLFDVEHVADMWFLERLDEGRDGSREIRREQGMIVVLDGRDSIVYRISKWCLK